MIYADGFDDSKWQVISAGYIPVWQSGIAYEIDVVVTRGNSMLRCNTAHVSTNFNNHERNNWDIIAGKGALIPEWQMNTEYGIDEVIIENDVIYRSNINHISGMKFKDDMLAGLEKWRAVNGGDSLGSMQQVTKLGVVATNVAPKVVDIFINNTVIFSVPATVILKFIPGTKDIVTTVCAFDNGDAGDFTVGGVSGEVAKSVTFDGTMRPAIYYKIAMGDPAQLEDGFVSESEEIDLAAYKQVEAVE